jgi:hypothetical protein
LFLSKRKTQRKRERNFLSKGKIWRHRAALRGGFFCAKKWRGVGMMLSQSKKVEENLVVMEYGEPLECNPTTEGFSELREPLTRAVIDNICESLAKATA